MPVTFTNTCTAPTEFAEFCLFTGRLSCNDGSEACYSSSDVCDGIQNCPSGVDETGCTNNQGETTCTIYIVLYNSIRTSHTSESSDQNLITLCIYGL